jgi:L-2-hydroxyglutarate oxidase LhgO
MEKLDAVVIGAGIIGLAIARALALSGREVVVLEKNSSFGQETSSRNSEVIHAGIYYPKDSLKASCCVTGNQLLYDYCIQRNIPHKKLGKLIVATHDNEIQTLTNYLENATQNGVHNLRLLSTSECRELEPEVNAVAAVLSPSTGIIDSHALMLEYISDIESNSGFIVYDSPVLAGKLTANQLTIRIGGTSNTSASCNVLINAGGLSAINIATTLGLPSNLLPPPFYAKGHYFSLNQKSPFQHLIYPVANSAGLGIHATLDLNHRVRFGPDVDWIKDEDYYFDETRKASFVAAIKRYYPALDEGSLTPGYTGIRPKISSPNSPPADFLIQSATQHGIKGLVNLFGIESPGLTSSLAISELVIRRLNYDLIR